MKTITPIKEFTELKSLVEFPVAVLYNKPKPPIKGEAKDLIADEGVVICAKTIINGLQSLGVQVVDLPYDKDVETVLTRFSPEEYVIFNLGEGMAGKFYEEARIAWALEVMGFKFTGNGGDAIARSTNKALAKALLQRSGLKTPEWWLFGDTQHLDDLLANRLPFPLIVKPVAEDGSIGLSTSAVVQTPKELRDRIAYIRETYFQSALAERFIVGRELNVALLGNHPEVLPLAEIDFSDFADPYQQIVSFEAKWKEESFEYSHTPTICPANLHPRLADRIRRAAVKAWHVIGCSGYARVDIRLDEKNIPYIVEVNCNPDISSNAGFHIAARTAGYSYKKMIIHILRNAWRRSDDYRQISTKRKRGKNTKHIGKNKSIQ